MEGLNMQEIINRTIEKLNKESSLDEIKKALKEECEKVDFSIDTKDWNYMFDEVLCGLA
jgi:hypothetical protein